MLAVLPLGWYVNNENKEKMLPSEILLFVQRLVSFVPTIYRNDDFMNVCQFALANGIPVTFPHNFGKLFLKNTQKLAAEY